MKVLTALFFFVFSWMYSPICAQQRIPIFELHGSVNHPLKGVRTFFGGGFGANVVFMDDRKISLKTGFETNFFHTWNKSKYTGKMSGSSNVHYKFLNLSIPLMFRINVGQRARFFLEAGAYLGIPLTGTSTSRFKTTPTGPNKPFTDEIRTENFNGYFSLSPAVSLGGIFPVSQRIDLILKPEFLFQKNFGVFDGPVSDFNAKFYYVRLCLGIRINLNDEIE
ncbi:hypothetical protein D3C71_882470 [compost metagenome]